MARKIVNGVQLTQQCWRALKRNPQLMIFPMMSSIALIIVAASLMIPSVLGVMYLSNGQVYESDNSMMIQVIVLLVVFFFYFACHMVIIFSNTALVGVSLRLLQGESATVCDGIRIAMSRLRQIIGFALVSATIGTLAKLSVSAAERESENELAGILAIMMRGLQGLWSIVVFFAIPVYVVENLGPIASMRRSWDIFKHTWGEGFAGKAVIGGVGCLAKLLLLAIIAALIAVTAATNYMPLLGIAILFGIISFVVLALFNGAINGVFQASLYHYATTGDAGQFIGNDLARNAFPA